MARSFHHPTSAVVSSQPILSSLSLSLARHGQTLGRQYRLLTSAITTRWYGSPHHGAEGGRDRSGRPWQGASRVRVTVLEQSSNGRRAGDHARLLLRLVPRVPGPAAPNRTGPHPCPGRQWAWRCAAHAHCPQRSRLAKRRQLLPGKSTLSAPLPRLRRVLTSRFPRLSWNPLWKRTISLHLERFGTLRVAPSASEWTPGSLHHL